jgi:hypothetical protein
MIHIFIMESNNNNLIEKDSLMLDLIMLIGIISALAIVGALTQTIE